MKSECKLQFDRFFIAQKIDGEWVRSSWEASEKSQSMNTFTPRGFTGLPFKKERRYPADGDVHFLAYSDDLWALFIDISMKIETLRTLLESGIGTEKGRRQLMENKMLALPSPAKKTKK